MECKRHRWRVGSNNGTIIKGKVVKTSLNIWCERCDKKLKAYYLPNWKLKFKRKIKNGKRKS